MLLSYIPILKTKENKIWTKDKTEPQHIQNHYSEWSVWSQWSLKASQQHLNKLSIMYWEMHCCSQNYL